MIPFSHNIAITAITPVMGYEMEVQRMDSMSVCGTACVYTNRLDSVAAEELRRNSSLHNSVGKSSIVLLVLQTSLVRAL